MYKMPSRRIQPAKSFNPYIPQFCNEDKQLDTEEPIRIAFTWAVRSQVTSRATADDVKKDRADYIGQAMEFNTNNMDACPRMGFGNGECYTRWRANVASAFDDPEDDLIDNGEIPEWMLDMVYEKEHERTN